MCCCDLVTISFNEIGYLNTKKLTSRPRGKRNTKYNIELIGTWWQVADMIRFGGFGSGSIAQNGTRVLYQPAKKEDWFNLSYNMSL